MLPLYFVSYELVLPEDGTITRTFNNQVVRDSYWLPMVELRSLALCKLKDKKAKSATITNSAMTIIRVVAWSRG